MTAFTKNTELITLACLMITLPWGNCKKENIALNCTITKEQNIKDTSSIHSINSPAINTCPEDYKNTDIIKKCEQLINDNLTFDPYLFTPITNSLTNVTYWNKYCVTCNNDNETKWQNWLSWSDYRESDDWCETLAPKIERSEVEKLPELTNIFINEAGVKLRSNFFDNIALECSTEGNWPIHLLRHVLPCLTDSFQIGQEFRIDQCQYVGKDGRICTKMQLYFEGFGFWFDNDKKINYNQTLSEFKFIRDDYAVETSYDGVFYICEHSGVIYGTGYLPKISISVLTLIFITIYLSVNFNHEYFQNKVNKMLYFYMIGLIIMCLILLLIYLSNPVLCVAFYLAQFSWFYHFLWTLLIFVEVVSVVCCNSDHRDTNDSSSRRKIDKFYIRSFLGLIIPIVLLIIYYFGVLVINENYKENSNFQTSRLENYVTQYNCPRVPDHYAVTCIPFRNSDAKFYSGILEDFLSTSFSFFVPALFILVSVIGLTHFTKCGFIEKRPNDISKRDHIIVLIKMASIMGIHWALYKIYVKYGDDHSSVFLGLSLDTICQFSIDFHGILVFIVFGIGSCVNKLGYEFKSVSQQDDKHGTGIPRPSNQVNTTYV